MYNKKQMKQLKLTDLKPITLNNKSFDSFNIIANKNLQGKTSRWIILSYEDITSCKATLYFFSTRKERDEQFAAWKKANVDFSLHSLTSSVPYIIK